MAWKSFFTSTAGRLFATASGLVLFCAGIVSFLGPGKAATVAVPLFVSLCVVGFLLTVGFTIAESPKLVVAMLLGLPLGAALYFLALRELVGAGGLAGTVLAWGGWILFCFAKEGYQQLLPPGQRGETEEAPPADLHAHHAH